MALQGWKISHGEISVAGHPSLLAILGAYSQRNCRKDKESKLHIFTVWEQRKRRDPLGQMESHCHAQGSRGWGLKNIHHFGKALAAKSFWRFTSNKRLSNQTLCEKYNDPCAMEKWIGKLLSFRVARTSTSTLAVPGMYRCPSNTL
jgi:hypothetical protein